MIKSVCPSTIFGPTQIKIWGKHGISRIGDGRTVAGEPFRISIGETSCGRSGYID